MVGGRGRAGGVRALPHGLLREGRRPLELHIPPRPPAARAGAVSLGPLAPRACGCTELAAGLCVQPCFCRGLPGPRPTAGCVHANYAWHVCNAAQCAQLQEQAIDCLYCMACYICTELCRLARAMRMSHDGDKHGASTGSCGSTVPRHSLVDNSTVSHDRRSCTHLLKRLSAVLGQTACLMLGTINRAVSSTAEQTSKRNLKTARYKNSALST